MSFKKPFFSVMTKKTREVSEFQKYLESEESGFIISGKVGMTTNYVNEAGDIIEVINDRDSTLASVIATPISGYKDDVNWIGEHLSDWCSKYPNMYRGVKKAFLP